VLCSSDFELRDGNIGSAYDKVRFGSFEVDVRAGELKKLGIRVRLQQQPFQVLLLLVEHAGELVTREELQKAIWPANTFVDFDIGLAAAVHKLRQALGDSAESPRFIETLPKRGYRFMVPVETIRTASGNGEKATPAATEPTTLQDPQPKKPIRIPHWQLAALSVFIVAAIVAAAWWGLHPRRQTYVIAVLPFKNLSSEPNTEYFSDGLTDEIIRKLSLVEGLEVRSHTSSFVFKDKPRNIADVGKSLAANLVLEGSVLHSGDRLRVNVDLVRVADDTPIWSERYDRQLADVFTIQDEISRSVVNELRLKQIGGQRRYNTDLETYDLFLKAESLSMATPDQPEPVKKAIALYEQVIARDPEYAPAYAGIATAYQTLRNPRNSSPEAIAKMREMARKAIELDPLLAESWATLGLVDAADLNWYEAEQEFRRSIQLNPNLSRARMDFAMFVLVPEGKLDEAILQVRNAAKLDPLAANVRVALGFILLMNGRSDEALAIGRKGFEAAPNSLGGQIYGHALMLAGNYDEAMKVFQQQGGASRGYLGCLYARMGRRSEAEQIAAENDVAQARHKVLIYAGLGDAERLFAALNDLSASNDYIVDIYPFFPELSFVRHDPRMTELRRKRKLPWPS
jgi:TolB-like protein/DNA-binding winged helix-turn-helix (wHTH) protein/Tfp pilus assembly protein PilF